MIIRNAVGPFVALILSLPLWAQVDQVAQFEIATAMPFGGEAGAYPAQQSELNASNAPSQATIPQPNGSGVVQGLSLYVLVGGRAVNSIRDLSATAPIVEVRDEHNVPVQGAEVVFQLPSAGPGGFFEGGNLTWTGTTDANGQVVAASLTPNREVGPFRIRVRASHDGRVGSAFIDQRNSPKPVRTEDLKASLGARRSSKWWKIAALAGAGGAAGGIIWATRGGDQPTILLQPGTVSFSGPR